MAAIRRQKNKVLYSPLGERAGIKTFRSEVHNQNLAYSDIGRREPLPYHAIHAVVRDWTPRLLSNGNVYNPTPDALNSQGGASTMLSAQVSACLTQARNKAYSKMVEKVRGERAALASALVEGRQSLNMVANRATQLASAYRNLRRGRFTAFLQDLHIKKALPKHHNMKWNRPKDASGLWLEYWFGWAPLVADIGTAIDHLQDPPVYFMRKFKSRGSDSLNYSYRQSGSGDRVFAEGPIRAVCSHQFIAVIENPNFHRANQLGFTNPGVTFWESVPWSFVVDWFYPVGQFLASANDFYGVTRRKAEYTTMVKGKVKSYLSPTPGSSFSLEYVEVKRYLGYLDFMPQPVWSRLSYTRAATAVSLLLQVFGGRLS